MGELCQEPPGEGKAHAAAPRAQWRSPRLIKVLVHPESQALHVAVGWHPSWLRGAAKSVCIVKKVLVAAGFTRKSKASLEHLERGWKKERLAAFFYY